jgi:hypothetical protein
VLVPDEAGDADGEGEAPGLAVGVAIPTIAREAERNERKLTVRGERSYRSRDDGRPGICKTDIEREEKRGDTAPLSQSTTGVLECAYALFISRAPSERLSDWIWNS